MVWKGRKLPTEDAPNFNPDDPYADPVALLEHREHVVWEKEVRVEEAKVSRVCSKQTCFALTFDDLSFALRSRRFCEKS